MKTAHACHILSSVMAEGTGAREQESGPGKALFSHPLAQTQAPSWMPRGGKEEMRKAGLAPPTQVKKGWEAAQQICQPLSPLKRNQRTPRP